MVRIVSHAIWWLASCLCIWATAASFGDLSAANITARAAVDQNTGFVGESIEFQITVSGTQHPAPPDLSSMVDFSVTPLPNETFNSESITQINGRNTKETHQGCVLHYKIVPKRTGDLVIPPLTVKADNGQTARSQPVTISVTPPIEVPNFKFRLQLSKTNVYVGEPVVLDAIWYMGEPARGGRITLPILNSDVIALSDPYVIAPATNVVPLSFGAGTVMAEQTQADLLGKICMALTFQKVIVARREGTLTVGPATLTFEAAAQTPLRSFKSGPPFPVRPRRFAPGAWRKLVIPSNSLQLDVRPLPTEARPDTFSGAVGQYALVATAHPAEVNLGDPITLNITLNGSPGLDHVRLPKLDKLPAFSNDFKISLNAERPAGTNKVVSYTLRPLRLNLNRIPAVELSYFDTVTETYQFARTKPIALKVRPVKTITAADAEGISDSRTSISSSAGAILRQVPAIVRRQVTWACARPEFWGSVAALTIGAFLSISAVRFITKYRRSRAEAIDSQRPYLRLCRTLSSVRSDRSVAAFEAVLAALKQYLGERLQMNAGALTFQDVAAPLRSVGLPEEFAGDLAKLFHSCDGVRLIGPNAFDTAIEPVAECQRLAAAIERVLNETRQTLL